MRADNRDDRFLLTDELAERVRQAHAVAHPRTPSLEMLIARDFLKRNSDGCFFVVTRSTGTAALLHDLDLNEESNWDDSILRTGRIEEHRGQLWSQAQ